MKLIIECDGPVLDVQPQYWAAYSQAAGEMGIPKTDPAAFWRVIRTSGPIGQALRGAKPRQITDFEARFKELLESDEIVEKCTPHENTAGALRRLSGKCQCALVTIGRNRVARQRVLDASGLSLHFFQMAGLAADASRRSEQIKSLAEDASSVVLAAASIPTARAGAAADMMVVGISGGATTERRLSVAGAALTFGELGELADDVERGGAQLRAHGLLSLS